MICVRKELVVTFPNGDIGRHLYIYPLLSRKEARKANNFILDKIRYTHYQNGGYNAKVEVVRKLVRI